MFKSTKCFSCISACLWRENPTAKIPPGRFLSQLFLSLFSSFPLISFSLYLPSDCLLFQKEMHPLLNWTCPQYSVTFSDKEGAWQAHWQEAEFIRLPLVLLWALETEVSTFFFFFSPEQANYVVLVVLYFTICTSKRTQENLGPW